MDSAASTKDLRPNRSYLCIDLKCFYASVECVDRGLDPMTEPLVVADTSRGRNTICLAISPALKAQGIHNRCRLFEIPEDVSYRAAVPRMRRYMEVSTRIYAIYLEFFSAEDIHVYSVDECFIDVTPYLTLYRATPRELADRVISRVQEHTGICATAGIGTNLFLAKVALDVTAKHTEDHIGYLDEDCFKCRIWPHRPITDIWGIGPGIARRLAALGAYDLGGVALLGEETLRREFGVNGELIYDHAWGIEPCTIAEIKAYRPHAHSTCNGQVLSRPYDSEEARVVLREMVDASVLDLVEKGLACGHISLFVSYAVPRGPLPEELPRGNGPRLFQGEHGTRRLGRSVPGTAASHKLGELTNSRARLTEEFMHLWDKAVDPNQTIKKLSIGLGALVPEEFSSLTIFTDVAAEASERRLAQATLAVKRRFGKNSLVRGTSFKTGATGRERNQQVGGHHE